MIPVSIRWFKWIWWPAWPVAAIWTAVVLRQSPCTCGTAADPCPKHELRFSLFSYLLARSTWITFWLVVAVGGVIAIINAAVHGS